MTATPGTRLLRAGVALSFGHMVMRGTRPNADTYDRVGAVVLLACLVVDSRLNRRELVHHHRALELLTDTVGELAEPLGVATAGRHFAGPFVHFSPWLTCPICRPVR